MTQQLRKFVVDDSGLVYDASYNPKLREDLYDVDPYPFKTSRDVESAVEEIPPLLSVLGEAYQDEMACPYTDPIEKEKPAYNRLNGSACYGCMMLPETSCENFNKMLDRRILVDDDYGLRKRFLHD